MPRYTENAKNKLLSGVAEGLRARRGGDRLASFVENFYRHAGPEDVLTLGEAPLRGLALSAWAALQTRRPDEIKLRVFNPTKAEDGFDFGYTVVEILNDDMPFLVDSVTADLNRTNITVHTVIHPLLRVRRGRNGKLLELVDPREESTSASDESFIQVQIDHHADAQARVAIENRLRSVLEDVRAAVGDWQDTRTKILESIAEIETVEPPVPSQEIAETIAFLRWLEDDHFTFIGYREYRFVTEDGRTHIEIEPGSGLGILRSASIMVYEGLLELPELPSDVAAFLRTPMLLTVAKANRHSTVQRTDQLDTVALRRFDAAGNVIGGRLFAGLFTSTVFTSSPQQIPVLRNKVAAVVAASEFEPFGHDGRGLLHILETLPRTELFQMDEKLLLEMSLGILRLRERQRVRLFAHRDLLGRWVSCLVYVPRDRFDTNLRKRLAAIVTAGFGGTLSAFQTLVSDEPMARVHYIVKTVPGAPAPRTHDEIEAELTAAARDWREDLCDELVRKHGADTGRGLLQSFGDAFPIAYRERHDAAQAASDIDYLNTAIAGETVQLNLYRPENSEENALRLKLYHRDRPQPLSDVLPILENMGLRVLDEIPHKIVAGLDAVVWIHDFGLEIDSTAEIDLAAVKDLFETAMRGICKGVIENDGFNQLVLAAGLSARRVVILRGYCKLLLQAGIPFSQSYMETTLARHPAIASSIVELFEVLFDPSRTKFSDAESKKIAKKIDGALEEVSSLDEDRILRRFTNAVTSTLRTNYFQKSDDGDDKPYVSFKLDSRQLDELPLPRPQVEVFVYSPRVEAVHLRGGKVARGGIRWSDRREDFRTEVLGLMKSQMTKNAVIVPVGAKGGFVVKRPPTEGGRDATQREAIECYKTLMRGLLDITDNLVEDRVVPPADVVRRDDDDPYLVVAADKGTATFSDIANGVAADYGFWLGDAFASGGSVGYDHKAMAITARGAWESIKRHFREMGIDPMTTDFTCVGVGDMSGDVFGNGALYSRHMRLVAAFNHLHIFVDPKPDAARSYRERARLFALPRSSWGDYDRTLISRGGGVFDRSAKSIPVSAAMRKLFGLGKKSSVAPSELMRAILASEVDLLFFGGIGTYVRDSAERDADAGDRSNDALRITGRDVRARIIGEGANLGVTQRGRIEYALAGGRINTDFIDNSAGVDCSDHEVNIKIALDRAVAAGSLTVAGRNKLLVSMTEDVAALVLRDNYRQCGALSEAERQSVALLDDHVRFLDFLERSDRLDRAVEFLPTAEEIDERRNDGIGMTRPELAVLLAYAKIVLQEEVLASDLPDDPNLADGIGGYFPKPMRKKLASLLTSHPLRREITATYVANTVVNRTGPAFVSSVQEHTGAAAADIARAYIVCREVFRATDLWAEVDQLDDSVAAELQTEMRLDILALIKRGARWFLRYGPTDGGIDQAVAAYAPGIAALDKNLDSLIPSTRQRSRDTRVEQYLANGAPGAVALRIANLDILAASCDIVRIASISRRRPTDIARAHYQLGSQLGIDWLRESGARLVVEGDRWRKAAATGLIDDLYALQADLTAKLIASAKAASIGDDQIEAWLRSRGSAVDRLLAVVADLRSAAKIDLPMLSVAAADLRTLAAG